jgi:polyisoprenoid-binding protein YceI
MKCKVTRKTRIFFAIYIFLAFFSMESLQAQQEAETYKVDPVHSSIVFKIDHLGVTPFYGRFNNASGEFTTDENMPENNFARVSVKVKDVDTQNQKRDEHLESADFFDAEKYPDIVFETKTFKKTGVNTFEIEGRLSFHGVERNITVEAVQTGAAKDPWGGYRKGFETSFSILRSDFGMDKMIGLVGDEVTLYIAIEGIRQ